MFFIYKAIVHHFIVHNDLQNNVPEDPLMRTMIVPEDVGDTANEFKFKGNGNHYKQ
jgi:hypothetical protein